LADRGNLNRYILDCFVVKLLAMTPKTRLIPRERLRKIELCLRVSTALLKRYQVISTEAPIYTFARCPALRRKTQGQAESTGAKWRNLFKKQISRLASRLARNDILNSFQRSTITNYQSPITMLCLKASPSFRPKPPFILSPAAPPCVVRRRGKQKARGRSGEIY